MTSVQQLIRVACLPIAMGLFLLAAQASGGFHNREVAATFTALK